MELVNLYFNTSNSYNIYINLIYFIYCYKVCLPIKYKNYLITS